MSKREDLTDEQWDLIFSYIIEPKPRDDGRGRERREPRPIMNGILWILRTGAQWSELPERYPPYQTCHRRYQEWVRNGTLENILKILAKDLEERGKLNLETCFIDGTFSIGKKGAQRSEKLSVVRVQRSWRLSTAQVFLSPLGSKVLRHMRSNSLKARSNGNMSKEESNH